MLALSLISLSTHKKSFNSVFFLPSIKQEKSKLKDFKETLSFLAIVLSIDYK